MLLAGLLVCSLFALAQMNANAQSNPLLREWNTPFGVPPFNEIADEHFLPALKAGIDEQRREVQAISANPEPPTFANTIEALDASGELLDKVYAVFSNLTSAETNDRLQEVARQVAPMRAALQDDILLDQRLFARVKAVWEKRDELNLNAEQRKLLEETYKDFVRGGANLSEDHKKRFREINAELSVLSVRFGDNLLKETNAYQLVIEDKADLAGLPEAIVSAAAEAARAAGQPGKWVFTLHAPSIWPFLSYAENRELRRQIFTAYIKRGDNGNEYDNKQILARIAALRAERAKLLGYPTYAHYALEERMAKEPAQVYGLLNQLWEPALKVARREAAELQKLIDEQGGNHKLEPWDWRYYAERIKQARYKLDEDQLREYFPLDNVLKGAFYVANRLYGLTFTERMDIPKYHPEVRTFEVKDVDGSHLGLFFTDYHPRPGKRGGAWSSRYRGQYHKDGKDVRPIVVNVCNFTRPSAGRPALLNQEEVETLFHEFGHALHSLLSRIHYRSLSTVPRDFVELPSQIMENWAFEPEVLKVYARHYKTGEVIPQDLVKKIQDSKKFNQGFATVEYLAASLLDMDWHTITGEAPDAAAFEKASLEKMRMMPEIVVRYRSPYFQHIFSGGYAAGYYSYIWSEVLDSDAFQAFKEKGLFDKATAAAFRKEILERGGTGDAMEMYKRFRGRAPSVEPLLERRGLK
ncbi:MAG TPA: M3 family metallopeptidase [Bryobacteraceae bacterium]|nr:M3 family metallopeptidase [Bryobacteraceae bacterium]HPU71022.1 M3 family metallopeptidase [Bryobacteraceae bacterium]